MSLSNYFKELFKSSKEKIILANISPWDEWIKNPSDFAWNFFDIIAEMDPETVHFIGADLWSHQISFNHVFEQYKGELSKVPLLTLFYLLRYGFPAYPNGHIFFWNFQDEDLDKYLELATYFKINLNQPDLSNLSLLHHFVINLEVHKVAKILAWGADPATESANGTALGIAIGLPPSPEKYQIVRQLARWGSPIFDSTRDFIFSLPDADKINRNIQTGQLLKPFYNQPNVEYFNSVVNGLSEEIRNKEIKDFLKFAYDKFTEKEKNKVIKAANGTILEWPFYMDETKLQIGFCKIPTTILGVIESI